MDQGQVIADGTHEELVKIVGEMDRISLVVSDESRELLAAWEAVPGVGRVLSENGTLTVLVEDSNQALPRLFDTAADQGVRITSVDIQEPNLETVFLHLTGRALRD
jgi:ABC-2 type transport system ATP-binding protein